MSARIRSLDDFLLLLKGVKPGKDRQFTALCPSIVTTIETTSRSTESAASLGATLKRTSGKKCQ